MDAALPVASGVGEDGCDDGARMAVAASCVLTGTGSPLTAAGASSEMSMPATICSQSSASAKFAAVDAMRSSGRADIAL